MSESMNNLEDVMMGNVSEGASESDEQIQARIAAAQAKLQKIRKDEKTAHDFDEKLAKLIKNLPPAYLDFVIFLIDHEVPGLTILAILSLIIDEAGKICFLEFEKYIESRADFSKTNLPVKVEEKISYWWTFIYGADHVSTTTKLKEFKGNAKFLKQFSVFLGQILNEFLQLQKVENFDEAKLKNILEKYQKGIFS